MKHTLLLFVLLLITITSRGQIATSKYAGTYSYGNKNKGGFGIIQIYPETDSTILFYIDVSKGAPSYNMGSLYGRVKIKNGHGEFCTKFDYSDNACKWTFQFLKNNMTITTIENQSNCGFGRNVYADGNFKRKSKKIPDHFDNGEGTKFYFKTTTPEEYNK